jgi:hypothetical protein
MAEPAARRNTERRDIPAASVRTKCSKSRVSMVNDLPFPRERQQTGRRGVRSAVKKGAEGVPADPWPPPVAHGIRFHRWLVTRSDQSAAAIPGRTAMASGMMPGGTARIPHRFDTLVKGLT